MAEDVGFKSQNPCDWVQFNNILESGKLWGGGNKIKFELHQLYTSIMLYIFLWLNAEEYQYILLKK